VNAKGSAPLWTLQRRYFEARGPAAWGSGEVPQYVTTNRFMADAYADLIAALLRDHARRSGGGGDERPVQVCELGGGSGRFAYHVLGRIEAFHQATGTPLAPLRYILTDVARSNLDAWRAHPSLQRHFEAGRLDLAYFDLADSTRLKLEISGETIGPGDLSAPLAVIANYVFDSIPQDVYRLADGVALSASPVVISRTNDSVDALGGASFDWSYALLDDAPYPQSQPELYALFDEYRRRLRDTHLLFPAMAICGLRQLAALSTQGLMLLSADKGEHRFDALDGRGPPPIAKHGCVSLPVNYHAMIRICEMGGGLALTPDHVHESLAVICLLMTQEADHYGEVRAAYVRAVAECGPDDLYGVTRLARPHLGEASTRDLLALLRLTRYDSGQFGRYAPRLTALAETFSSAETQQVVDAVERVWAAYFPLAEQPDLASLIAGLLYAMDLYGPALTYYRRSVALYGEDSGTLFNMASCHYMRDEGALAKAILARVLQADPKNAAALSLLSATDVIE
jgi:hypothetical protein